MNQESTHTPVLLNEVIAYLNPQPNQNFIDGTVGGGGHAAVILKLTAPHGRLLAFDRDKQALALAQKTLVKFGSRATFIHDTFANLVEHVTSEKFTPVHGILFDLGLSSDQLADKNRGFSFQGNAILDLRYDTTQGLPAYDLLNKLTLAQLTRLFREFGEEPKAYYIAQAIISARRLKPFHTTHDLLTQIDKIKGRTKRSHHPATLIWQALRIAVNNELDDLERGLAGALNVLSPNGSLAVISFHSGEDRLVKNYFKQQARNCVCPENFPVCRCQHRAVVKLVTSHPITASTDELEKNTRARSAKLRVVKKI